MHKAVRSGLRALPFLSAALLPAMLTAQTTALPAARDLVARHVAAIGGRDAVTRHPFYQMRGTFEMAAVGLRGDLEIAGARPNLQVMKITIPGAGEVLNGFDGTNGWSVNPFQGPRLLEGQELAQASEDAEFAGVLRESSNIASMETVELTTAGGQSCHKVKVTWKSGRESFDCYSVDTGLLVASFTKAQTPMGEVESVTVVADYKDFGGVKQPTKITQSAMGQEQVITITSYEYGPIQAALFTPPAAIATLISQKPKN